MVMLIFWIMITGLFALGVKWLSARGATTGAPIRTATTTEAESGLEALNLAYISGRMESDEYDERRRTLGA